MLSCVTLDHPVSCRSHVDFGPTLPVSCRQNSARGKWSHVGLMSVLLCKFVCSRFYYVNLYVVKFVCKFVCSVGGQSYSNTDPSGIQWNLRTLNCCMTESVRNQYRSLRWLEIAGSANAVFEPTRARARSCVLTDRPTRRRGRVARIELDVYIIHSSISQYRLSKN